MADLPREWLDEHVFPFTHTYFGLFEVKLLRRILKRWCYLFTCLTTRAVHIEVAQSLNTESCLDTVTRFIARRGYPNTIISDNGTNFVGAANELKTFMNEQDKAKIESDLAQKKIVWKFNPPGASHLGGTCERLVQNCKKVMIAILDNLSLTALPKRYSAPIPTLDSLKWSSYDVSWRDCATSLLAWQPEQYTSKLHSHWTPSHV